MSIHKKSFRFELSEDERVVVEAVRGTAAMAWHVTHQIRRETGEWVIMTCLFRPKDCSACGFKTAMKLASEYVAKQLGDL